MRLLVMGTGPFAVPMFEALLASRHDVAAVVTRPLRQAAGRRQALTNPMRDAADRAGPDVLAPEDVNSAEAHDLLRPLAPELLVVADYGQILSPATLALAPLGGINLHASLLPKYRGAAPVAWAIYHGEKVTGVTVIHMTPKLDAGPAVSQASLAIEPDETADVLEARLAQLAAKMVVPAVDALQSGEAQPVPQDAEAATRAPRLKKSDGEIDWSRTAEQIKNQVRAMWPWPKAFTSWHRPGGPPLRLIVGRVAAREAHQDQPPGTVVQASRGGLLVAAGCGTVELLQLQPAGKRMLSAQEWLRGYHVQPGERFGPAA